MKTKNFFKATFLSLLLANLVMAFSFNFAFAQTETTHLRATTKTYSGVQDQIKEFLCTPSDASTNATAAQGDLYTCINKIYRFALIIAAVFGVFMLVIAGFVYMSAEGNEESVSKAKDILVTTVTSLVILTSGYVLLNFLNPDLVKFQPIQPESVVGDGRAFSLSNISTSDIQKTLQNQGLTNNSVSGQSCNQSYGLSASQGCSASANNCSDVSNYTPAHDCQSNGGTCLLSSSAAARAKTFIDKFNSYASGTGCTLKISSTIQVTQTISASTCHRTGTCVDFNLQPSYSTACAQAFYKAAKDSGAVVSFLDEYVDTCKASTTTGGNIHTNF